MSELHKHFQQQEEWESDEPEAYVAWLQGSDNAFERWSKRLQEERKRDVDYLIAALEEAEEWIDRPAYRRLSLEAWRDKRMT